MVRIVTDVHWLFAANAKRVDDANKPVHAAKPKGRPGKRERQAIKAAKDADKATLANNLSSPKPVETWSKANRRGNLVMGYQSTTSRDNLLKGTHTMGFHSSSIRGHKEGGASRSSLRAIDGFTPKVVDRLLGR